MPVGGARSLLANRAPRSTAAGCWLNLLLDRRLAHTPFREEGYNRCVRTQVTKKKNPAPNNEIKTESTDVLNGAESDI